MPEEKEYQRPSPEALLKLAKSEEEKERGRLTIYFGAAPGVGKTYAMLLDARQRKKEGIDVVVGYVETHGRPETAALLEGLEIVPSLVIGFKGMELQEADLAGIIARKPKIALVDELAHTDAPGLRHEKRYQDIEEMLNAGIDVYTTLNVQHLESLNDIIYKITNVRVKETVPDSVLEKAYEIELIDLPPEALLKRLREGKVYLGDLAGLAAREFFRPGNLLALRQLALRAVAGSVDERMRDYMQAHAIAGPWPAKERVLVGVFASPYAETLIRSSSRLATDLDAEWVAFYLETERHKRLSDQELKWLNNALILAKKLGARVVWLKGNDLTEEMASYARNNNVTKIVIGKPRRFGLAHDLLRKILKLTPDIDIYLIDARTESKIEPKKRIYSSGPLNYAASLLAVGIIALVAFLLRNVLNQVNLLFFLLLPVVLSAIYLGRGPSIASAIVSIAVFDYLFVRPYFTFNVHDMEYFVSFIIYIVVVVIISNLALRVREEVALLKESESRNTALYELSRELVTARNVEQVLSVLIRHITEIFPAEVSVFLPSGEGLDAKAITMGFEVTPSDLGVASWVWANRQAAGWGTGTFPGTRALYLPMIAADSIKGVLGVEFNKPEKEMSPESQVVLETVAGLGAMALERIELACL
ncbi:MAG: DUF4118 domain-containing protein [Chloroflexi bacterium]|nr:DUF4118 domain-containing protein [Chloroflexota bacterium]